MKVTVEITYTTTQALEYKGVKLIAVESERKFKGIKCLEVKLESKDYKVETFWVPKFLKPIFKLHAYERMFAIAKKQRARDEATK